MIILLAIELQQAAKQLTPHIPSPPRFAVANDGANAAPHPVYNHCFPQKKTCGWFALLSIIAALVLLLLTVHLCVVSQHKTVRSRVQARRLSGREEEQQEDGASAGVAPEICEMLGKVGIIAREEEDQHLPRPGPSAPSPEALVEEERPRKRKQKIKWLEQGPAPEPQLNKKHKPGGPSPRQACCIIIKGPKNTMPACFDRIVNQLYLVQI